MDIAHISSKKILNNVPGSFKVATRMIIQYTSDRSLVSDDLTSQLVHYAWLVIPVHDSDKVKKPISRL